MPAAEKVHELIERFERNLPAYKQGRHNETLAGVEFINPLFKALGWKEPSTNGTRICHAGQAPRPMKTWLARSEAGQSAILRTSWRTWRQRWVVKNPPKTVDRGARPVR